MVRTLVVLLCLGLPAAAQPDGKPVKKPTAPVLLPSTDGESFQIMAPADGLSLEDFLGVWSEATGQRFSWRHQEFRGRGNVIFSGLVPVRKEELDFLFQGILVTQGFALIPTGPPSSQLYKVESFESSRILKQRAPFVSRDKIQSLKEQPARVYMTSFALDQVDVQSVRSAVQQLVTNRAAEHIAEIRDSNTIVAVAFGPTLAAIDDLLKSVDRALPKKIQADREAEKKRRGK
ncbi:MAG: hypothetical protein CMJ83_14495 [Planctomycetes bacterium]|nr:hypothetical protein [Planctomycetota bacterium]